MYSPTESRFNCKFRIFGTIRKKQKMPLNQGGRIEGNGRS